MNRMFYIKERIFSVLCTYVFFIKDYVRNMTYKKQKSLKWYWF